MKLIGLGLKLVGAVSAMTLSVSAACAADIPRQAESGWSQAEPELSIRLSPYAWLPSLKGTQTIRARSVDVDASFLDVARESDTLVGLMLDFEARYGRWSLIADAVWQKIGLSASDVRTVSPAPGVAGTVGAALGVDVRMTIVELAAAFEFARSGPLAFDVLAGGRYWSQKADASLDLSATADLRGLTISGSRAFARSGSVSWVDPIIGGRVRFAVSPGNEIMLRADVGGFGTASRFSWQGLAAYGFEFATRNGVTYSGLLGYRALYVDYGKGADRERYRFDMLQHGPIVGISVRF